MYVVIMQARVELKIGDRIRYNARFTDDRYTSEIGTVTGFAFNEKDPERRYWVKVAFDKDQGVETFIALAYALLEEQRTTVAIR